MSYESKIKWMEYPQHKPQCAGYYMAIQDNVVGCGFFSILSGGWGAFLNETEEDSNPDITHWAYFPDAVPAQPKTEQFDGTIYEYLDRLIKEAAPAWGGVDPDKFIDEVRGRTAGLEWKKGVPKERGKYLIRSTYDISPWLMQYHESDSFWSKFEILWHIGPIPPVPQNDEA